MVWLFENNTDSKKLNLSLIKKIIKLLSSSKNSISVSPMQVYESTSDSTGSLTEDMATAGLVM